MADVSVPPLAALTDPDEDVRRDAAEAFGKNHDRNAVVPLMIVLERDPDWQVREAAAYALGQIGDPQALPVLERVQNSVDVTSVEQKIAFATYWAIKHIAAEKV